MPDNSAILALPYIQPSQAQKHVTHNEALNALDVLVQLGVAGFGTTTPPVDPDEGETHALGPAPTGVWVGQGDRLATWRDGVWTFITPLAGWRAWGASEGELRIWDGTSWGLPVAGTDNLDGVGINTSSDATNRLSVKADATLLSHDGGGHQLKINKAGAGDTASLLFQSDWSGHAEMGLSATTDFTIKVSDDGTSWREALRFDGASGTLSGTAVQAGPTDTTPNTLMHVGAFGLGASIGPQVSDLDALEATMAWRESGASGSPDGAATVTGMHLAGATSDYALQIAGQMATDKLWWRRKNTAWQDWLEIITLQGNGDLNIDNGTLFVDTVNNRVGIGTTSPDASLHLSGSGDREVTIETTNNQDARVKLVRSTGSSFEVVNEIGTFKIMRGAAGVTDTYPAYAISSTRHFWYDPADGAEAMRMLAGGDLAIGASSGTSRLNVASSDDQTLVYSTNTNASFSKVNFYANNIRAANAAYDFLVAYSGNFGDLEFRMSGDGNGTCDGSWTGGGADYAEYFEWADGNPKGEDRRGISVALEGNKIRKAKRGEDPIGVISGNPSVVGDAAPFRWKGKYLRDGFGSAIMEDYQVASWREAVKETLDDGTEISRAVEHSYAVDQIPKQIKIPKDATRVTQQRRKLNPDYNPASKYTPREGRPEWDIVGLMGKLRLRKRQVTGARWVKMRDVSDVIEEWLVR